MTLLEKKKRNRDWTKSVGQYDAVLLLAACILVLALSPSSGPDAVTAQQTGSAGPAVEAPAPELH